MNGKFYALVEEVAELFYLNVLWLICSLPIITIGASTTALLYVLMRKELGEDSYLLKDFFRAFKNNFLQSSLIWVVILFFGSIAGYLEIRCIKTGGSMAAIAVVVLAFVMIVFLLILLYVFALLARFDNTVLKTVLNAFLISVKHIRETLFMLGLLVAIAFLLYMVPYLIIAVLLFGASGYAKFAAHRYLEIFDKIMEVTDGEKE